MSSNFLKEKNYVLNLRCRLSCPNHISKIPGEGYVELNMSILGPLTLSAYGGKFSKDLFITFKLGFTQVGIML